MTIAIILRLLFAPASASLSEPVSRRCNVRVDRMDFGEPLQAGYLVCGSWTGAHRWVQTGDCRWVCPDAPWREDVG